MKRSTRALICCANVVSVASVIFGLAHCSGGERPEVGNEGDASMPRVDSGTVANGSVSILGYEPNKGVLFGDDGFVNCGGQAADKVLTFQNTGREIVRFKAKLTAGSEYFAINPAEGGVPVGGNATLQITPKPIPQTTDVTPDLFAGTVEVQFSNNEPPTVIRLHQTPRGAIVTSTLSGNGTYDFGDVKVSGKGTFQFSLTNAGNLAATANFALGSASKFKIDGAQTAAVQLEPGQTIQKTLTVEPDDSVAFNDSLAVSFNTSTVHCKAPPQATNLKAKGATSVVVSPGTINYGQIDCGGVAPYQIVTIDTSTAISFTPVLVKGEQTVSPYTLANDANGAVVNAGEAVAVTAGTKYKLRVVPKAIPAVSTTADNGFQDTLRIETTAVGDQPHLITLNQTARGAVFTVNPTSIAVQDNLENQQKSTPFTLLNNGNASAPYTIQLEPDGNVPPGKLSITLSSGTMIPAQAIFGNLVSYTPPDTTPVVSQYTATMTIQAGAGAKLCADLPAPVPVVVLNPPN